MRDFALGILFGSTVWFACILTVVAKAEKRIERLGIRIGVLEEQNKRLRDVWQGLTGKALTVIEGGK